MARAGNGSALESGRGKASVVSLVFPANRQQPCYPQPMDALLHHPLFLLFLVVGLGLALGKIQIYGLSLGSSGVLFAGLVAGHFGLLVLDGVGTLGLVLFTYCVGLGAGGRFFSALRKQGQSLVLLALLVTGTAAGLTWVLATAFAIPGDLAVGLFAGALTSTPALAAATEYLGPAGRGVSVGYGIAYPFGVIGVVLFVQLLPRLLRADLSREAKEAEDPNVARSAVQTVAVRIEQVDLVGQRIADFEPLRRLGCQVTRVQRDQRLVPLSYEDTFAPGQVVLVVGREDLLDLAVRLLGRPNPEAVRWDGERERRQLLLLEKRWTGQSISDLEVLRRHRVIISRVTRLGFTFVPTPETVLERNDLLTTVGTPEDLETFAQAIGHRPQTMEEADLFSIGLGVAAGLVLGVLSVSLPGGEPFSLGLVGGPLLAGLLLGHFGKIGPILGQVPRSPRLLLQELGLVLFLADAGVKGGQTLVATLSEQGGMLLAVGAAITIAPLAIGYVVARYALRLRLLPTLGGLCGGMTSTPALGAITAKTDSQAPVVSYATAYPLALILMTLLAKLLLGLLGDPTP